MVRKKNRGRYFSNKELLVVLEYLEKKKIKTYIAFTAGLPFEKKADMLMTLELTHVIRERFSNTEINADIITLEPAAPWFLYKRKYGIISKKRSFDDFCLDHENKGVLPGYRTQWLSEKDIRSALALYRAQARCVHGQSRFLRVLLDSRFAIEQCDVSKISMACKSCEQYASCFNKEGSHER